MIVLVISGGQTGADQAGWHTARAVDRVDLPPGSLPRRAEPDLGNFPGMAPPPPRCTLARPHFGDPPTSRGDHDEIGPRPIRTIPDPLDHARLPAVTDRRTLSARYALQFYPIDGTPFMR